MRRTLEKGMHNPGENKIYFTEIRQIENELFEVLVLEEFMNWRHRRELMNCMLMNFRRGQLIENPNIINGLMIKVQELPHEINCMNDTREFKDVDSVRSKQLSHVPSESGLFPLPSDPGGLLSSARNRQPDTWDTHGISRNVFASSPTHSSTPCSRTLNSCDDRPR